MFTVYGTLATQRTLDALQAELESQGVRTERRDSSHYRGGHYLRLAAPDVHCTLEQVSDTEALCRADATQRAALSAVCAQLAQALRSLDIGHRLELYDEADELLETLVHP